LVLGLLLAESRADDEATSVVGQALLQLETVPSGQWTGLVMRSAVSLALWTSEIEQALSIAEREWPRALDHGEPGIVGDAASTCLEAAAAAADHGRDSNDAGLIARARALADRVLPEAEAKVAMSSLGPSQGARHEAELALNTARAHRARVRGDSTAAAWAEVAAAWGQRSMPYREAKARWWQALSILGAATDEEQREAARVAARDPLAEAYRLAHRLSALPLLREVIDLARRARVSLLSVEAAPPPTVAEEGVAVGPGVPASLVPVGPGLDTVAAGSAETRGPEIARAIEERVLASLRKGPEDAYGLSPRERDVLNILAEGRTDRDIAGRLFISERTVHVHVRHILSKLGVSSRTQAAGVAIRQGLVPQRWSPRPPRPGNRDDVASTP
jgi:DNA-binding CsgD family transcriptional regulator